MVQKKIRPDYRDTQIYGELTTIALHVVSALSSLPILLTKTHFPYHTKGCAEKQFSWEDSMHLPASLASSPWTYLLNSSLLLHVPQQGLHKVVH